MALKDWSSRLFGRLGGMFGNDNDEVMQPNMANGGTGGYRPGTRDVMGTRSMMLVELNGAMANQGARQPAWQNEEMNNGPQGYPQQGMGNGYPGYGAENPYQTGYQNGYQTGYQTGYQPQQQNPNGYMNQPNGYANGYQNDYQTAYQNGYQNGYPNYGYEQQMAQTAQPVYSTTDAQQPVDNISYMNNQFRNENGTASRHVERITAVSSLSSCFRVIEFLRNGESVIVNLESIAVESEVQRILDLLAGAAFTLDVSLTRITASRRAYLLAPATVSVMQDESLKSATEYRNMAAGQVGGAPAQAQMDDWRSGNYAGPRYSAR